MKRFLILLALTCQISLFSQSTVHPCATNEINASGNTHEQRQQDVEWYKYFRQNHPEDMYLPSRNRLQRRSHPCDTPNLIIPIWVHVVHQNGVENISQAQIEHSVHLLNEQYGNHDANPSPAVNTGLLFYLAGVDRINSPLTDHNKNTETPNLMALNYRNQDSVVNIWIVKRILTPSGVDSGTLGYSTYPWSKISNKYQGIVLRYDWFGHANFGTHMNINSGGKTLAHEMGHYLGLYHPFDFGCIGLNSTDCYSQGDLCCDVPAVAFEYQGCSVPYNTCVETYNNNPADQKQNYMDYSFDTCKNTFTADQTK